MRQECVFYQVSEIPCKFVHVVFIRAIPNFNLPQGLSPGNTTPCGEGGTGATPPTCRAGTSNISVLSKADFLNFCL